METNIDKKHLIDITQQIKQIMGIRYINTQELAQKTKVSKISIERFLDNKYYPNLRIIIKIVRALESEIIIEDLHTKYEKNKS